MAGIKPTKADWEGVLALQEKSVADIKKAYTMQLPQIETLVEFIKKKVAEFPDDDPMPDDVKEVIKEVSE